MKFMRRVAGYMWMERDINIDIQRGLGLGHHQNNTWRQKWMEGAYQINDI